MFYNNLVYLIDMVGFPVRGGIRYISYFSMKTYVVTPHQNCLDKTVLVMGQSLCFKGETKKIIPNTSSYLQHWA